MVLILALFALSSLEGVCKRENWNLPVSKDCKRYLFLYSALAFLSSLLVLALDFLDKLFNYLQKKEKPKGDLILVLFKLMIWFIILVAFMLIMKSSIKKVLQDFFENLAPAYSLDEDSYYEDDYEDSELPKKRKPKKKVTLKDVPKFISKFSATFFKLKQKPSKKKSKKKKRTNKSFCIDYRAKAKYFKPKINS